MQGDVIIDKENVVPRGKAVWSQQAVLAKNKGLGAGHDAARKEKPGILASNATTNNGGGTGGLGSLELLKERVKLLKLSSTKGTSADSRFLKYRSPLVDINSSEGTVNSSLGSLSTKDGTGQLTAQERSSQPPEVLSFSKLSYSRANGSEQSERNYSSGGHVGSKSSWLGSLKVLELYQEDSAKSRDGKEASRSRVEAWVNEVGQPNEHRGSTSPGRSVSHNKQSSSTTKDSVVWSGAKRHGTPYKRRLPLLEEAKAGKITIEDEAQSNNNEPHVSGYVSPAAAVSLKPSQPRTAENLEARGKVIEVAVRTSNEGHMKIFGSHSIDRVSERRSSEYFGSRLFISAERQSGSVVDKGGGGSSEKRITLSENPRLTGSSGFQGYSERVSPQEDQHEKEASKWASSHANTDAITIAPGSSVLLSKMTGASSSGSSATPGLTGSSRDDDTVGYSESSKQQTPSPEEHVIPSSRERMSSRTRISKRLKALGPASRLLISGPALRVAVEEDGKRVPKDDGSPNRVILCPEVRSSPLEQGVSSGLRALSPVTPEEGQLCPDTDLLAEFKKRKAEDDPSIGDVSQGENECSTENKSPYDKGSAFLSTSDLLKDVRTSHLKATLRGEYHRLVPGLLKVEDCGTLHPPLQRGAESANGYESQFAKRASPPDGSFELVQSAKGVFKKFHDISVADSKLSRRATDKPYSSFGLSQDHKDMVSLEQGHLLDREVAPLMQPIGGVGRSVNLSVSSSHIIREDSPSYDSCQRSSDPNGSDFSPCQKTTSDVREGSEAVSMSQDGLSLRDKSDTRPGSVQELSGSLGSLSLVDRDVQTKAQIRLPLQNLANNSSSTPPLAPVNQSSIKSLESLPVFPNTSHSSGKSAVTTENEPSIQHSRSFPSEKPREELSGALKENHFEAPKGEGSVKPALSQRSEGAAANVHRPGEDPGKDDGKGAFLATQRRVLEDEKFFWVNDERYQKLGMIGKGGSSEVYKVINRDFSIHALKKIILGGRDHSTALGFYQEIEYLERLRGKRHIVQLIDYEVSNKFVVDENYGEEKIQEDACIYMVLEFGEIDLAGILSKRRKEMLESNEPLDDNWIRFYWKHMLSAVKTIHDERIVHADLKPANFLLVKGELKLIDFGIAKAIQTDTTHVVRDSQVGTLNYMPPEALMNNSKDEDGRVFKCGRSSDIWSLGCILYQMVYGHTPYSHIRTMFGKIQAITSRSFKIDYPPVRDPWLLDVMKRCLTWDRHNRPDIVQLLVHPFLRPDLASHK